VVGALIRGRIDHPLKVVASLQLPEKGSQHCFHMAQGSQAARSKLPLLGSFLLADQSLE
jgi:hypothetical protein